MPATDLLIDGYNLLHAAGYAPVRYATGELQRARQRLLKKLFQLLTPSEIAQTAVVFDAKAPPPGLPKNWYIHGLRVMYAQPHGDADEMLELLINEHSAPRQLTVVSSDHRLHRAAKSRRAMVIKSDDFLAHLEQRHPGSELHELPDPAPTSPKATGEATSAELEYWMRLFGDVKISELSEQPTLSVKRISAQAPPKPRQNATGQCKTDAASLRPIQSEVPPNARRKQKPSAKKKSSTPIQHEELESKESHPVLFSQEWIDELQNWVDGIQRPT